MKTIKCPKCQGKGEYEVFVDHGHHGILGYEWEKRNCEVCHCSGKIMLDEWLKEKHNE